MMWVSKKSGANNDIAQLDSMHNQQIEEASFGSSFGTIGTNSGHPFQSSGIRVPMDQSNVQELDWNEISSTHFAAPHDPQWRIPASLPVNGVYSESAACRETQEGSYPPAGTSYNAGRQSRSYPIENGIVNTEAIAMSPSQQSSIHSDTTYTNGFSTGSQTAFNQFPASGSRQVSASTSMHADGARLGALEARGRYNTGEYNGDGSCLWSYGSAGTQPEAGMWGGAGGIGSGLKGGNLQPTQRAGRWEAERVAEASGQFRNGGSGSGSVAETYPPAAPNLRVFQNNTNGNGNAELLNMILSRPSTPVSGSFPDRFTPPPPQQLQQYSYTGLPYMPAAMTTEQAILERHLAELGLREDMVAQQAANAQERERRQQQLAYLKLLQQQQTSIRRQQQQLSQQQQAIASAAASLQHDYGQQMQQGRGMRHGAESPYQRVQTQLYQQQLPLVGLRAQPALHQGGPPMARSKQQHASLPINDKRRQPVPQLKRLPKADITWLSQQLCHVVTSLMPTSDECARQAHAFDWVSQILKARWPEGHVHQFGSTANCLAITANNDIDICLELTELGDDPAKKAEVVEEMARLLEGAGMRDVLPLGKARVPVVKCIVPETGTQVDVTLNHTMALINTKLLADYCAIDGRLMQLAFIVKHWAKQRQVNDAYRGTLSSYCYVLMCIHLLQRRQPPILPCLQAMQPHTHQKHVGPWDCGYYDKVGSLVSFGAGNTETLGELVWAFFEYWAWKHDFNTAVVSVRTGGFLTKAQKEWTRRVGNERHLVSIEYAHACSVYCCYCWTWLTHQYPGGVTHQPKDPFELSHDLGRTVDRQTSMVLHKEFERAACILRDMPGGIEKLLEPYRAGTAPKSIRVPSHIPTGRSG